MKKVININFQGRVIPIEETAYDILKQYIESLRRYFANEDGRDEIISDIESRIAELFSERLKKGTTCITDDDVQAIIVSMGRPEDFEAQEAETSNTTSSSSSKQSQQSSQQSQAPYTYATVSRGRLYRNADDKIIGGVCSGLANYFNIDPAIMRIIFVLLFFTGPGFIIYVILWIVIPAKSLKTNITKRLYRSEDSKVIAGVCGGLASYFNIDVWIPRLIFALPLIIGLISGPFNLWWGGNDWDFWWGPKMITGGLGSTLFVCYVVLWIAVPVATSAAEKLEMRGEKVDLNSIRNAVNENLETLKSKAQTWSSEVKQSAQNFGERAKTFASTEAAPMARGAGHGIAHIIGVLFKSFFLLIAGCIALALFAVFFCLVFGGFSFFPLKDFFLMGFWQNFLAWVSVFLFLGIPVVGLLIWLIRRIIGVRSRNHYLGYIFGTLWFIGIVSTVLLFGFVGRSFKTRSEIKDDINITQPAGGELYLGVASSNVQYYGSDWFGIDWHDWPFYGISEDTIMLNTIRVNIVKSTDSVFHVARMKFSRGRNPDDARNLAEKVKFNIEQKDSALILPQRFAVSINEKWRNQQVLVVIAVPEGKRFLLDRRIHDYNWFNVRFDSRHYGDDFDNWNDYWVESGVEYIMSPDGPKRVRDLDPDELKRGRYIPKDRKNRNNIDENDNNNDENYKYHDNKSQKKKDSSKKTTKTVKNSEANGGDDSGNGSETKTSDMSLPLSSLSKFFQ